MVEERQAKLVKKLYATFCGRWILCLITRPWVSRLAGKCMDSPFSKIFIKRFVRKNNIALDAYEKTDYRSFNDFFTRKIRPSFRPVAMQSDAFVSPCDGKLSVHPVKENSAFQIKGHSYTMRELVNDDRIAGRYESGVMLVFRLTVSDYHRYHYPDSGRKSQNTRIKGILHTVIPIAAGARRIYCENAREYFTLSSDHFGEILMIQVGALLVGRICNKHQEAIVQRGDEAGWFEYGGSTVIVCLEKHTVEVLPEIMKMSESKREMDVKMGQIVGFAAWKKCDNRKQHGSNGTAKNSTEEAT